MRKLLCISIPLFVLVSIAVWWVFRFTGGTAREIVRSVGYVPAVVDIVKKIAGFEGARTYLVLLQNNHELRPTGGFIGAYGIVKIRGGAVVDSFFEGSELLDARAPVGVALPPAPIPVRRYLNLDYLFFRDSNWQADFRDAAATIVAVYASQKGKDAVHIDGVIAVTPEVLKTLINYTGPIEIDDVVFEGEGSVDTLEYEVEVGYTSKDIPKHERKDVIGRLGGEIHRRLVTLSPEKLSRLLLDIKHLADTKDILLFDYENKIEDVYERVGWSGSMGIRRGDYIAVVDANLQGFKTDRVMERVIDYSVVHQGSTYKSVLGLTYTNRGIYDYRTREYRAYTRVFLPPATAVTSVSVDGSYILRGGDGTPDVDIEHTSEYTIVGFYHTIPLQSSHTITLAYTLNPEVVKWGNDTYELRVRKQPGTRDTQLTVKTVFDTPVLRGVPKGTIQGTQYVFKGDLNTDQNFLIDF